MTVPLDGISVRLSSSGRFGKGQITYCVKGELMKARSMVFVLSLVCIVLVWRAAARPIAQQQGSLSLSGGPIVVTDADILLLRQDLRTQKQKLIAQNLPMTESE